MRRARSICITLLAFAAAWPACARGGVVYSNFAPGDGFQANMGFAVYGADIPPHYESLAAGFTPGATVELGKVEFAAQFFPASSKATDRFLVEIRDDANNGPGTTVLESFVVSFPAFNSPAIVSLTSSSRPTLTAGDQYWLAISPETSTDAGSWQFTSSGAAGLYTFAQSPEDWGRPPFTHFVNGPVFRISDSLSVPEPCSLALVGIGAALARGRCAFRRLGRRMAPARLSSEQWEDGHR